MSWRWAILSSICRLIVEVSFWSWNSENCWEMADRYRLFSIEELPSHLIFEILTSGRLSAVDLAHLELTSKTFGGSHGLYPQKFRSLVDLAASQLCALHSIYAGMSRNVQIELLNRCNGNWKRVLRFLQSVEHSSDIVETSAGNVLFLWYICFWFWFLNEWL